MKKFFLRIAPALASLVLCVGVASVNSPSMVIFNQPKVPAGLEKYRK